MAFPAGEQRYVYRLQSRTQAVNGDAGAQVDSWSTEATFRGGRKQDNLPNESMIGAEVTQTATELIPMRFRTGMTSDKRLIRERDETTLSGAINASVTALTLAAALNFNGGTIDYLAIDSEIMRVTAGGSTTSLTVERGALGTTAASHSNGATVYRVEKLDIVGTASENELADELVVRAARVG